MKTDLVTRIARELQSEIRPHDHEITFHGKSMLSFLEDGDIVTISTVNWDEIRLGDIIAYRYEYKLPTRRVIWKSKSQLFLGCDGWPNIYFRINRSDVLGRAVARRRGRIKLTAQDPKWCASSRRSLIFLWWQAAFQAPRWFYRKIGG